MSPRRSPRNNRRMSRRPRSSNTSWALPCNVVVQNVSNNFNTSTTDATDIFLGTVEPSADNLSVRPSSINVDIASTSPIRAQLIVLSRLSSTEVIPVFMSRVCTFSTTNRRMVIKVPKNVQHALGGQYRLHVLSTTSVVPVTVTGIATFSERVSS